MKPDKPFVPYKFTLTGRQILTAIAKHPDGIDEVELAGSLQTRLPELRKALYALKGKGYCDFVDRGMWRLWSVNNGNA